jgi:tetratricopeptide (TPR) repeat protein
VEDVGRACNNLSVLLGTKGDLHRAVEVHLVGLETYERSGWDLGRGYLQSNLGVVYFLLGEWDAAQVSLDRAIRAGEAGFPMARLNAIPWRAALEMRRGRGPLALSWLETARPEVEKLGEFQHMRDFYPVLAECLRQGGRMEEALQAIDHVVAVWRPLAPLPGAVPMLGRP